MLARQNAPRVPFASRKNVLPIGSRMASFDGATSLLTAHLNFSSQTKQSVPAATLTDFLHQLQFPPSSKADEGTPFLAS